MQMNDYCQKKIENNKCQQGYGCQVLGRGGNGELLFNRYEFQFYNMKTVLEMDIGCKHCE